MEDDLKNLILIVDDNPHNIQVLAAVVSESNYTPGLAMSGQQALDFLEENPHQPDLILLDVMMPEMDGFEVCRRIKQNIKFEKIPIIFLTAKTEKEDIIKGLELGAVDYITKPFNNKELKIRIKTHIDLVESKKNLVKLNKKLQEYNDTKDKFFSIIAHDLRGPIGNMNEYVSLISEEIEELGLESLKKDFSILKDITKTSYNLLESLLVWSSSQKDVINFNPKLSNFYKLVQSNIELFNQISSKKQIKLNNKVDENLEFRFDYNMINTVVRNLINNSIKYTDLNGEITVIAEDNNDFIKVSVIDNGVGINKEVLNSLFKIDIKTFSQEGTRGEKGTGFGLILCKEFIDKHKGLIWVESEKNKGSRFSFSIPK